MMGARNTERSLHERAGLENSPRRFETSRREWSARWSGGGAFLLCRIRSSAENESFVSTTKRLLFRLKSARTRTARTGTDIVETSLRLAARIQGRTSDFSTSSVLSRTCRRSRRVSGAQRPISQCSGNLWGARHPVKLCTGPLRVIRTDFPAGCPISLPFP